MKIEQDLRIAKISLNSTQSQLKLRRRLDLVPPDPPTQPPGHPPTRDSSFLDSALDYFLTIHDKFKDTSRLLKDYVKAASTQTTELGTTQFKLVLTFLFQ